SANDANFTLTATATTTDGSTASTTAVIIVDPLAPTISGGPAASGLENSPIPLTLGVTINNLSGPNGDSPANSRHSLVISAIPLGATLSDGHGHSFTATSGNTSVDVSGWSYTSLTITPANDSNFTLNIAATEQDADGNVSAPTTNTEAVTVNPLAPTLAPVAGNGVEGSPIALNPGLTLNNQNSPHR